MPAEKVKLAIMKRLERKMKKKGRKENSTYTAISPFLQYREVHRLVNGRRARREPAVLREVGHREGAWRWVWWELIRC